MADAAVSRVHGPDDPHVRWYGEAAPADGEVERHASFVEFEERHQLPENTRKIAPVDLIDDEENGLVRMDGRFCAQSVEHAVGERQRQPRTCCAQVWFEALDEVLVPVGGVEGDHVDPTALQHLALCRSPLVRRPCEGVGVASQSESGAKCEAGFAGTRWSMQDHLAFAVQCLKYRFHIIGERDRCPVR